MNKIEHKKIIYEKEAIIHKILSLYNDDLFHLNRHNYSEIRYSNNEIRKQRIFLTDVYDVLYFAPKKLNIKLCECLGTTNAQILHFYRDTEMIGKRKQGQILVYAETHGYKESMSLVSRSLYRCHSDVFKKLLPYHC